MSKLRIQIGNIKDGFSEPRNFDFVHGVDTARFISERGEVAFEIRSVDGSTLELRTANTYHDGPRFNGARFAIVPVSTNIIHIESIPIRPGS